MTLVESSDIGIAPPAPPAPVENARAPQSPPESLVRRLSFGAAWVVAGRVIGVGATVVSNAILAREFSAEDFGTFLLISSIIGIGASIAVFGLNGAGVRFVAEDLALGALRAARHAFRLCVGTCCIATAVVSLLMYVGLILWSGPLFAGQAVHELAVIIVGCVALYVGMQMVSELLRGFHDLKVASLLNGPSGGALANSLFCGLLVVGGLWQVRPTLSHVLEMQLLAMAAVLPWGMVYLWRKAHAHWAGSPAECFPPKLLTVPCLIRVCVPLMMTQVLMVFLSQVDLWIAGVWFTKDHLALYGVARRMMVLVAIPTQMAALTVMSSIPDLYARRRMTELQQVLQSSAGLAALPSMAAMSLLFFVPGWTLGFVFGDFYSQAAVPLVILAAGQLLFTWVGSASFLLALTGHHHQVLIINVATTATFILIGPLAAKTFGIIGLATASSVVLALQSLAFWIVARWLTGLWTHPCLPAWPGKSSGERTELPVSQPVRLTGSDH